MKGSSLFTSRFPLPLSIVFTFIPFFNFCSPPLCVNNCASGSKFQCDGHLSRKAD